MPRPRPAGRPREYGKRVATQIRLPLELHQRLKGEAEARGISVNRAIIQAIERSSDHSPTTQVDEEAEVETCAVSDSGCLAPAGWLGGTVAADGRCEACGDPVCSNCRHGEDGPCFDCLPEDEEWDGRSIV